MHKHALEIKMVFQRPGRSNLLLKFPILFSLMFPFTGKILQPVAVVLCLHPLSFSQYLPCKSQSCWLFCRFPLSQSGVKGFIQDTQINLNTIRFFSLPHSGLVRLTVAEQLGKHYYLRRPKNGSLFTINFLCA